MSNRRLQVQQRRILRRRTTPIRQQASNIQRYYRLLIMWAHRPSIMVPVLHRGTGSRRLNNNRIFAVTPQGGLSSGHGGPQQASCRLPHQFVTALTIRTFLRRMSQNDPAAMSTYGRIRATCLPCPPAQNRPAPPPPPPTVTNAVVVNERVRSQEYVPPPPPPVNNTVVNGRMRSQEPAISEESATDDSGVSQPYIDLFDSPIENGEVETEEPDLTLKL